MHWCCRQLPNLVEAQKPRGQSSHGRSLAIEGDQGESSHGESYTASHHRERGAEPKPKNSTRIGADSRSWSKPDGQGPRPPEPLDGPSRPSTRVTAGSSHITATVMAPCLLAPTQVSVRRLHAAWFQSLLRTTASRPLSLCLV